MTRWCAFWRCPLASSDWTLRALCISTLAMIWRLLATLCCTSCRRIAFSRMRSSFCRASARASVTSVIASRRRTWSLFPSSSLRAFSTRDHLFHRLEVAGADPGVPAMEKLPRPRHARHCEDVLQVHADLPRLHGVQVGRLQPDDRGL